MISYPDAMASSLLRPSLIDMQPYQIRLADDQALFTAGAFTRAFIPTEDLKHEMDIAFLQQYLTNKHKRPLVVDRVNPAAKRSTEHIFNEAVLAVCNGDIIHVRCYLERTDDTNIFLGTDDIGNSLVSRPSSGEPTLITNPVRGQTVLHIAAGKGNTEMVDLLLSKGADPNARDTTGRTPLMQAALYGQVQNVHHLLAHGAIPSILCFYECYALKAVDFARYCQGKDADMNLRCKNIIPLLLCSHTDTLRASTNVMNYQISIAAALTPQLIGRTAGIMARLELPIVVLTKSRQFLTGDIEYIDASMVGVTGFPEGPEGLECVHAAQQLAEYFLRHHQFPEVIHPESHEPLPGMEELHSLKNIQPHLRVRRAEIGVTSPTCLDCSQFIEQINMEYELDLRVSYVPGL
ncbi:hypothetical protein E0Z10_g5392 [Xylaria hypoxylon]|uniref:Uncharacterized protein n=1 Tax=Xylaria hypoxylon TaxID=37992 RepID=A0A4Z0Z3Z2_9PEZI|nr:hypothetical protein E0Z10_g5392 [Xylaria hypoxylon]